MVGPTLKGEICKQRNVLRPLFTFGELGKDEEPLPSMATSPYANTLKAHREGIQVTLRDTAGTNGANSADPSQSQENERDDNTDGKNPARDGKRNGRLDLSGPLRESE